MARVVKVFRTLRNHWKKSTFGVCVLSYGGYWLYGRHRDNVLRREACLVAREYGRQQIAAQEQLRRATVILNPSACSGKANNLFEKNAAPILHLAGVDVKVVKTDYEGQAKKLMELMEQTDMLIVAGGDGTLQEVITGLLRRADQEKLSNTPIGFIPLGSHNSISPSLQLLTHNQVQDVVSATLSVLRGETVPLDVLQIKGEREQPVFALMGLRWGAFRDAAASVSRYWFLGPLRQHAAYWFRALWEGPLAQDVSLAYTAPSLRPPDAPPQVPPRPSLLYRIARRLRSYWSRPAEGPAEVEEPEEWTERRLTTVELSVQTHNRNPVQRRSSDSLLLCAEPDQFSVGDFVGAGRKKEQDPAAFTKRALKLEAGACRLQLPEAAGGFYDIDNEEYEAVPVEVRLLPRKLHFFISAERRQQLLADAERKAPVA